MTPPVFAHGALRLYLLALLEDGPKHGYELIKALGDRFGGTYSPSAGTVYPRLGKLEEEGLVATSQDGRRTVYSITDAGRAEVEDRRGELEDVEQDISASVRRLADTLRDELRSSMRGLRADLAATAETARQAAKQAGGAPSSAGGTQSEAAGRPESGPSGEPAASSPNAPTPRGRAESLRDNRGALAEAEMLIRGFRDDMRLELREFAAAHTMTDVTLEALRQSLDATRTAIRTALRGPIR
ncbi:PadR family transcriptional regulator [Sinomonas sp. ASV486]|uniref:PadR family transcriptional regulator n=1 Tax=Sinomonas sp. ASV486 TaxID=3051170 RepID=UPI0027DD10CC|nr:PadR family transcriptional regulator [Sinomonas sp. ASV486]MDQ4490512.1 PadR family transcriptional regulator [Sinomonas sp. ASV486]